MSTTTRHVHRADPARQRTVGWTHCVAARNCSGASHGCVTHVDECRCGAIRRTEVNQQHVERGTWEAAS